MERITKDLWGIALFFVGNVVLLFIIVGLAILAIADYGRNQVKVAKRPKLIFAKYMQMSGRMPK